MSKSPRSSHGNGSRLFETVWRRNLVYNQCWEDPAVDRKARCLTPDDHVLAITSAGCNALDYALTGAQVLAVDANPRQNHLPELKRAGKRRRGRCLPPAVGSRAALLRVGARRPAAPRGSSRHVWLLPYRPPRRLTRAAWRPSGPSTAGTRRSTTGRARSSSSGGGRRRPPSTVAPAISCGPGHLVLDVGCGTGFNLPSLAGTGATVVGIECTEAMRRRAAARLARLGLAEEVRLDRRPYGGHRGYEGKADRILFSYSLSMMRSFAIVLERARLDLRPGGRLAVVDFLDAVGPMAWGLERSHVCLGEARLRVLSELFPDHALEIVHVGLWHYFTFCGRVESSSPPRVNVPFTRSSRRRHAPPIPSVWSVAARSTTRRTLGSSRRKLR